ncbi:MAG: saccharopine dehydrogenase [Bacteroidetes bacterium RIFCSPLOWO2_02_FULL_36_8]|nr:MAG: saccharopine dehydrogenase [Bacteroidetes bacterium RIFCSPLOWO2_02_FULL_36_8]OFY69105.1 MAG: saccharopine dehydrogenase [Bacteroidetes bacterium RIFCSPLOWO2_12_FULL_37_12]
MKSIIVLGAGLVGGVMAKDLSSFCEVTCADINEENLRKVALNSKVKTVKGDLTHHDTIRKLVDDFDLVVGALPGFMGFHALHSVISAGKNIVDISFFPEDPFLLDDLAKKNRVTAVTDCGVAPGMSNMILGYHHKKMKVESFECLVGGLPVKRTWPYEYKVVFSAVDVIEEYKRPARMIENGKMVVKTALSEPEFVDFDNVGTLEAFNTDGLRSVMRTMNDIPNMKERTLRYPGHIEYMHVLRETGFFDTTPVRIGNSDIRPIDFTAKLLFPLWKLKEGEEDFTVMRITVKGTEKKNEVTYVYNLLDYYDRKNKVTSMARTTGYTCTSVAQMMLEGKFNRKGICPPEYLGENEKCFNLVLEYLKKRKVVYDVSRKEG